MVADTVTCAQDHDFADLSLLLGNFPLGHIENLRGHALVDVAVGGERGDHIFLLSQPRQHPCLDLCGVSVNQHIPAWRNDRLLDLLGVGPPAR